MTASRQRERLLRGEQVRELNVAEGSIAGLGIDHRIVDAKVKEARLSTADRRMCNPSVAAIGQLRTLNQPAES